MDTHTMPDSALAQEESRTITVKQAIEQTLEALYQNLCQEHSDILHYTIRHGHSEQPVDFHTFVQDVIDISMMTKNSAVRGHKPAPAEISPETHMFRYAAGHTDQILSPLRSDAEEKRLHRKLRNHAGELLCLSDEEAQHISSVSSFLQKMGDNIRSSCDARPNPYGKDEDARVFYKSIKEEQEAIYFSRAFFDDLTYIGGLIYYTFLEPSKAGGQTYELDRDAGGADLERNQIMQARRALGNLLSETTVYPFKDAQDSMNAVLSSLLFEFTGEIQGFEANTTPTPSAELKLRAKAMLHKLDDILHQEGRSAAHAYLTQQTELVQDPVMQQAYGVICLLSENIVHPKPTVLRLDNLSGDYTKILPDDQTVVNILARLAAAVDTEKTSTNVRQTQEDRIASAQERAKELVFDPERHTLNVPPMVLEKIFKNYHLMMSKAHTEGLDAALAFLPKDVPEVTTASPNAGMPGEKPNPNAVSHATLATPSLHSLYAEEMRLVDATQQLCHRLWSPNANLQDKTIRIPGKEPEVSLFIPSDQERRAALALIKALASSSGAYQKGDRLMVPEKVILSMGDNRELIDMNVSDAREQLAQGNEKEAAALIRNAINFKPGLEEAMQGYAAHCSQGRGRD